MDQPVALLFESFDFLILIDLLLVKNYHSCPLLLSSTHTIVKNLFCKSVTWW